MLHRNPKLAKDHAVITGNRAPQTRASIVAFAMRNPPHAYAAAAPRRGAMGIMGIVWMIVVGFVVGLLARFFYPGAVDLGFWMTTLLGIGGSLVGGVIGGLIWKSPEGKFQPAGLILSIIGSMILIWVYLKFLK
jgi:uncharacterized membrane protein YeaQ/YmgE (transglycosylase-associated protein family)